MNELDDHIDLDLLRSIHADLTADPLALARVRASLVADRRLAHRRRRALWIGVAAALAVVTSVSGGLLLTRPDGSQGAPSVATPTTPATPERPAPPASAPVGEPVTLAAFTVKAAATVANDSLPTPGQYRKVSSRGSFGTCQSMAKTADGTLLEFRSWSLVTLYVPGDPAARWVRVVESWSEPCDEAARAYAVQRPRLTRHHVSEPERARQGDFAGGSPEGPNWNDPTQDFIDALPAEPAELLASARAWNRSYHLADDPLNLLTMLTIPLQESWIADGDLRAALFQAIGRVEGITVRRDVAVGERTGTALRGISSENPAIWREVVFDPDTFQVIGTRFHTASPDRLNETSVTSKIVSAAP